MNQNHPGSILVVGEDSHFCYLLQSYMRSSAYQILFASSGSSAFEIAQCEKLAAIVVDLDSPAQHGWNLLRTLKVCLETQSIPIITCTWLDQQERCAQEGADAYLRMPILYADFRRALSQVGVKIGSEDAPALP